MAEKEIDSGIFGDTRMRPSQPAHLLRFAAILILLALLAACAASRDGARSTAAITQPEAAAPAPKPAPPPKPASEPVLKPAPVPAVAAPSKGSPSLSPVPAQAPALTGAAAAGTAIAAISDGGAQPVRPPLARRAAKKSRSPASLAEPRAVPEAARPVASAAAAASVEPSSSSAAPLERMAPSAFHIPSPITLGQSVVAQLRIDPGKHLEGVRAALGAATAGRPGELQAQMVEVAKRMRAELKGDEKVLRIRATSPSDQPVNAGETTVWTWSVTGLEPGDHELTVTLLKLLPDGEKTVPTPVYKVVVKVPEAGLLDRIIASLKKLTDLVSALDALIAAVLALLATAGFVWARKRKSGGDQPPAGG